MDEDLKNTIEQYHNSYMNETNILLAMRKFNRVNFGKFPYKRH